MMLIVDAHEDLAWNMLTYGRDYTLSAAETRQRELGSDIPRRNNGDTLLGWPDYQRGQVAVVFATLFVAPIRAQTGEWDIQCYRTFDQAHALSRTQLDAYHRLADEHPDKFRLINTQPDLQEVLACWEPAGTAEKPVGLVILMENAEGVRQPGELEEWWAQGVRLIGPAWAGTRFCGGSHEPGPLTKDGVALLERMAELGFTLDLSHMDELAAMQALDIYPGAVIASHANPRALLPGTQSNRHLTDRQIRGLVERGGVIGIVPLNSFLKQGWKTGDRREEVSLQTVAAHIDYICKMAGDARHVGLGTDFDGGFGLSSVPVEVDTIADMQKIIPFLVERGYTQDDVAAILGGNWLALLHQTLPEV